jgi:hypothetical protein
MDGMCSEALPNVKTPHLRTECSYNPGTLVADHHRQLDPKRILVDIVHIRGTDGGRTRADQQLIWLYLRYRYFYQLELVDSFEHQGFHNVSIG